MDNLNFTITLIFFV